KLIRSCCEEIPSLSLVTYAGPPDGSTCLLLKQSALLFREQVFVRQMGERAGFGSEHSGCPQTGCCGKALVPCFVLCSRSVSEAWTQETAPPPSLLTQSVSCPLRSFALCDRTAHC
ncbi:mCG145022, partial [Mus musculus]